MQNSGTSCRGNAKTRAAVIPAETQLGMIEAMLFDIRIGTRVARVGAATRGMNGGL
jgi:hypothetical protein